MADAVSEVTLRMPQQVAPLSWSKRLGSTGGFLDPVDAPGLIDLHKGEVERQFLLAVGLELDGEDHLVFLEPRPA